MWNANVIETIVLNHTGDTQYQERKEEEKNTHSRSVCHSKTQSTSYDQSLSYRQNVEKVFGHIFGGRSR